MSATDQITPKVAAQTSLDQLEARFAQFPLEERQEIETIRAKLRVIVDVYGASAILAMMCTNFEHCIKEGK